MLREACRKWNAVTLAVDALQRFRQHEAQLGTGQAHSVPEPGLVRTVAAAPIDRDLEQIAVGDDHVEKAVGIDGRDIERFQCLGRARIDGVVECFVPEPRRTASPRFSRMVTMSS